MPIVQSTTVWWSVTGTRGDGSLFSCILFAPDGEAEARRKAAKQHNVVTISTIYACTVAGHPV